ncbi:SDR family NAD(P)-dependent oxidoreductase [Sphingobium sp. LB126]|uniref:SDR family NAD(P)-dependent oxidoreductase n=1 Tax=Sphingobium sp. LB126 TaxID=1983755 RepID=UPI0012FD3887|nr:SDR family NAD(P)-dependent oxidoreductase [Sphingobium sp. LB126]
MIRLDGRVAVVTGAGRGMGRTHALLLAARGAKLLVNDYGGAQSTLAPGTISHAQAVVDEIRAAGGEAEANADMVGTGEAARAIVDHARDAFGRVDILINNAGGSLIGEPDAFTDEEIEGVLRTNFIGPYMLLRRVWPLMRDQGFGRIVNVMSSAVLGAGHLGPYAAGKAGLLGLTQDAAFDGRPHNILVNGIFPTGASRLTEGSHEDLALWYRTHFQPEKVSALVAYLCSDALDFGGEVFNVGGGRVARLAIFDNDGLFDPAITPESIATNIDLIRDLSKPTITPTLWAQTERYFKHIPWTGGKSGLF